THAMARRLGLDYIVIRKTVKSYMENPIVADVRSITTTAEQHLVMDSSDVQKIYRKKVAVIDDVVSTGGSIHAVEEILSKTGCEVAAKAAPLLEEGGHSGEGIIYLEKLPVFPD
ncbi:MAG: phosphoribosyltransferase family protein, partial [Pyramidobacter sp.]|nr:phosphoribosyltransferase family protein [Pyramidobacter sp.]